MTDIQAGETEIETGIDILEGMEITIGIDTPGVMETGIQVETINIQTIGIRVETGTGQAQEVMIDTPEVMMTGIQEETEIDTLTVTDTPQEVAIEINIPEATDTLEPEIGTQQEEMIDIQEVIGIQTVTDIQ